MPPAKEPIVTQATLCTITCKYIGKGFDKILYHAIIPMQLAVLLRGLILN